MKQRALVVDDHFLNQLILKNILEQLEYEAETAASGVEALQKLSADHFDIVFMDLHMPGMSGFDCTVHIRTSENTHVAHLPVIAVTADAQPGTRQTAFNCGVTGFVEKPVTLANIEAVLAVR